MWYQQNVSTQIVRVPRTVPTWYMAENKASFPPQPYLNVPYSIFFCIQVISSTLVVRKQRNTLRFGTIRLKWKTGLKKYQTVILAYLQYVSTQIIAPCTSFVHYTLSAGLPQTLPCWAEKLLAILTSRLDD
jgi:hypothetical protein